MAIDIEYGRMIRSKRRRFQRRMRSMAAGDGFPNSGNTGPRRGSTSTFVGIFNTTSNDQIVENMRIVGPVIIKHNNVIIRDCFIDCNDIFGISTQPDNALTPALIEYCTIKGGGGVTTGNNAGIATFFTGVQEVRFCNIYGYENGIFPGGSCNLHDNYIHDLGNAISPDPHVDGMQFSNTSGLTIVHNTIVSWDTSCIISNGPGAGQPFANITIQNNKLLGRGGPPGISYGMSVRSLNNDPINNVVITGNRIGNIGDFTSKIGFPIDIGSSVAGLVCNNNFDYYTGVLINPSIG